ncbi:hypothetical protein BXY66_1879 [Shimia isoporae]|uniref:Uncharacterized protein n=1 Tax=Shimia isoporae TaxID=647720 RepID=A0A4R1NN89_9RHOB|nr:DUF2199 domain-containing protein [Shimia isoporae]TCL09814.1 hypothetical protein BXY66_1879 [Shimia isoporae]
MLLALDSRWRRFNDPDYVSQSGKSFTGVFDIGYDAPDIWPHAVPREADASEVEVGDDKLSADLCRLDGTRFVHCVLPLAIKGSDEVFNFGPWAAVEAELFYAYVDVATGASEGFVGGIAFLMNDLPGFESDDPIACQLIPGAEGQRPRLTALDGPLKSAQSNGISFDQLLDIYAHTGNDVRPHLNG